MTWKLKFEFANPDLAHYKPISSAPFSFANITYVVEVVTGGNGTRRALTLANGEKLPECAGTRNRRLVGTGVCADLISASIRREGAEALSSAAWIVIAVVLDDVVLSLRRIDPAIDGEV